MHAFKSATELRNLLRAGKVSARDLLEAYFARIDRYNGDINAVIWQDRAAARRAADAIGSGDPRPLAGIPMTVKESYDLAGAPTTWGIPALRNNVARTDSVVVARLREAGAVIFGKTNVPMSLADFQSFNDIYGTTNNPWNLSRGPGGSSGGSAAALAAGLTGLEMGSDIGGSIRNPAHFCGVFGHKPTWALIPNRGQALPGELVEPDIAVVGPLARSAADLDLALDVLAKPDVLQAAIRYELPTLEGRTLGDLRIAVWANDAVAPVSQDCERAVRTVAQACRDAGARVDDSARPAVPAKRIQEIYMPMVAAELGGHLDDTSFAQAKASTAALGPGADDIEAQFRRGQTLEHYDWLHLHNAREQLRWAWHDFFRDWDVLLAPVASTAAFPHDHNGYFERTLLVDNGQRPYFEQIFWAGMVGIAHLPSTVVPTMRNREGLPVGVQVIGPAYGDRITIGVARLLEDAGLQFTPPPAYA